MKEVEEKISKWTDGYIQKQIKIQTSILEVLLDIREILKKQDKKEMKPQNSS